MLGDDTEAMLCVNLYSSTSCVCRTRLSDSGRRAGCRSKIYLVKDYRFLHGFVEEQKMLSFMGKLVAFSLVLGVTENH